MRKWVRSFAVITLTNDIILKETTNVLPGGISLKIYRVLNWRAVLKPTRREAFPAGVASLFTVVVSVLSANIYIFFIRFQVEIK